MADDDDLPIGAESAPGIEGDAPNPGEAAGGRKERDKDRDKARIRRPERAAQPVSTSPREKLISVLTGGRGPAQRQEAIINVVEAAFGIGEADPIWVFLLPPLLQGGRADDNMAEVRELIASIKSAGLGKAGAGTGMEELSEAIRETTAAINAVNLKLEKSVERAVSAALAKSETSGGVDQAALARSVSDSIGTRLMPARIGLVAGALAIVAAVAFVGGVMINKSGYDKYIAELEGKIQGYQSVLVQQKGPER
jgi:hypothetical protein